MHFRQFILKNKIILLIIALLSVNLICKADNYRVTVHGQILYLDAMDMQFKPMVGVKVEVWDSDVDGSDASSAIDDYIEAGFTDINGNYSIEGAGGDPGNYSWSKPDIYILVVLTNEDGKLRITDELDNTQYFASDLHSHDNVEGRCGYGCISSDRF